MKFKILFISCFVSISFFTKAQDCSTEFSSHRNSSIVTAYPVTISGKAKKPIGGHIWILAHLKGFNGWYPQGNGERSIQDEIWTCAVYLGTPEETGYYEIAIAVVNDQVNQALNNWVSKVKDVGYYPIPFPDVINECSISMITVEKR